MDERHSSRAPRVPPQRRRSTSLPALLLGLLVSPTPARGGEDPPAWLAKLAIHGYLTQAYATAEEHPILGVPLEGTADYRTAALQFRYAMTADDHLVLQLSHEAFGASPVAAVKEEVELDWAFYEHRFSDATRARVGKVQIPLGIYNEIRDVGTLLPFYRPPFSFYGEGAFTSETVDGAVLSHVFRFDRPWGVDSHLYYGGWDLVEIDPGSQAVLVGRVEDQLGVQLWLETPLPGLRLGAGGSRFTLEDQLLTLGGRERLEAWHASVDGSFDRFVVRGEVQQVRFPPGRYDAYYLQAGLDLGRRWALYAQAEVSELRFAIPFVGSFDRRFGEDFGVALHHSWRSDLVLKAEAHWADGFRIDEPIDVFTAAPRAARYYILSLSASF